MGFYSQVIFPRLCDLLLGRPFIARRRRELLARAFGAVLEIGFGTGLNLPHYPERVRKLTTVDPNVGMHRLARKRVKRAAIPVDQRVLSGERLPFENDTFDCVVTTFTLCSIEDVGQALAEVYRLLKPGGKFLFLEHGLSPQPGVQKWQRRLNWLEMRLAAGCRLDRNIKELIAAHPFASVQVEEFYLEKTPRTHGYLYRGIATKSRRFRLLLPRPLYDEMLAQARAERPNECCGILAGTIHTTAAGHIGQVVRRYPLVNAAASPKEYVSEGKSMFAAVRDIDRLGLDILAVYHSHPTSDPVPSRTDRERNYSPDVINLIVSLKEAEAVRGWWLNADECHEAAWELVDELPSV